MLYGKDKRITKIGFTFSEGEIVCRRSSDLGMRVGTYIHTISVQGSIKIFKLKELNDVYHAMNRIGISINQIAKFAKHTGSVFQKRYGRCSGRNKEASHYYGELAASAEIVRIAAVNNYKELSNK